MIIYFVRSHTDCNNNTAEWTITATSSLLKYAMHALIIAQMIACDCKNMQ